MKNSTFTSIQIQDFGPVWRGKVELRPLTVFTGASNTGKSWVAMLVYALAQHSLKSRRRNFIFRGSFDDEIEGAVPAKMELDRALDGIDSEREITVSETLLKIFDNTRAKETKYLEIEIARTFGFQEIQQAINWNSKRGASVHVTSPANSISKTPSLMSIKLGKNHFRYESEYPETLDLGKLTKHEKRRYDMFRRLNLENQGNNALKINKYGLARFFYRLLSDRFFPSGTALYLPAGRVGLMDSFRTIVGSSIQSELDNVPIGQFQSRPLSGVLVDFLQMLTGVTPNGKSKLRKSAAFRLEQELLFGSIEVVLNQLNFPYFFFRPLENDQLLPLNLSSSMVSQLAPVVLILKEIPVKNNLIILEEPEAHLHPMQQVRFLQEIAKWVRDGNKILLTTHSEWITEALSNLVMENKIDPKVGMKAKDIGLWRFIGAPKGTEIKESVWNPGAGGYDDGFEEVGDQMLNEWTWYKGELS